MKIIVWYSIKASDGDEFLASVVSERSERVEWASEASERNERTKRANGARSKFFTIWCDKDRDALTALSFINSTSTQAPHLGELLANMN